MTSRFEAYHILGGVMSDSSELPDFTPDYADSDRADPSPLTAPRPATASLSEKESFAAVPWHLPFA